MKMSYDAEGDILSFLLNDQQISNAREEGDIILNFNEAGDLVEIEILNASNILGKFVAQLLQARSGKIFSEIKSA